MRLLLRRKDAIRYNRRNESCRFSFWILFTRRVNQPIKQCIVEHVPPTSLIIRFGRRCLSNREHALIDSPIQPCTIAGS